jgi:CHASE2 domain-containing sensor protein
MRKPLHKHIGNHAKRMGSHFTKYLYERDTVFATLWVFLFIVVLGSIPLNLGILNPIKLGLKDFDFNDMYYSKVGNQQLSPIDSNIVVINIGMADREGIAAIIDKTASYQPKVMGLDVMFEGPRDPHKDSLLTETIKRNKNLVLATKYQEDSSHKLVAAGNFFKTDSTLFGYVNFPYNDDKSTIRAYYPFKKDEKDEHLVLPSFSSELIRQYNPEAYEAIKHKIDKQVIINYTRKVTDRKLQYQVLDAEAVLGDAIDSSAIKGRIALLAYFNPSPTDIEDKKFTPMNEKYAGKSVPDMNGILIHANIISMVLEHNFIKKVPLWLTILIAVLVCWLHMSFFVRYYLESHIWFHLVAKIAQVASGIFFIWLGIYIYNKYHLKVDLKLSLVTIVMAVDVIYFYEAWAVWMHKKFNYQTVFKPHHH